MKRQPEGIPAGGQFAADRKAEPTGQLVSSRDEQDAAAAIGALSTQVANPDPKEKRRQHRDDRWALEMAQTSFTNQEVAEVWRDLKPSPYIEQSTARLFSHGIRAAFLKHEQAARTITPEQRQGLDEALVKLSEASEGDSNDSEMDAYDDAISEATSLIDVDLDAKASDDEPPYVRSLRWSLKAMDKAANGDSNDREFEAKAEALDDALYILGIER